MTNIDQPDLGNHDAALGVDVLDGLRRRELIRSVRAPVVDRIDPATVADRIEGTIVGLALGDAFATWAAQQSRSGRPVDTPRINEWLGRRSMTSASTSMRLFEWSADALLVDLPRAPQALADRIVRAPDRPRLPGRAIGHARRRLQQGAPWHEAAAPSYGNAALPRAVAVGLRLHRRPELIGVVASLDSVVTHSSRRAASSSAALAAIIAELITRPEGLDPHDVVSQVLPSVDHRLVRTELETTLMHTAEFALPFDPTVINALRLALWSQQFGPDLAPVLEVVASRSRGDRSTLLITTALFGAACGAEALPPRASSIDDSGGLMRLAARFTGADHAAAGRNVEEVVAPGASDALADIWFLVDRSGSMASISDFVVTGFDDFFVKQRADVAEATVTVVQFDDDDPHDVIVDASPLDRVPSIRDRFAPRGMTPLYDAVGLLLDRAERHGGDPADQLVVILTDGGENASTQWTHRAIFERIADLRARGWTFVFLGANQDSYEAGGRMSMPAGNVSNFRADEMGVSAAYSGLDRTVSEWRGKSRRERRRDADTFWGDRKEAEDLR